MRNDVPCPCLQEAADESGEARDRYVSFVGLDCNGQARKLVGMLRPYMEQPEYSNPFWTLFAKKLSPISGPRHDELFLIHAHINILRDQLETLNDVEALQLLDKIEMECC
ncbi:N(2)-fixation sustaining protein CowN [Uliginosibacterium aquaticum]|uniref:N(2)-fixation sustaining protein CowN n=1 Tax=Uliginosibacterium aquaticum TaxID=2731212 RepID=A0ABX2IK63_9RHOO|nr:N(2)-fixation sustaining protein CowN [Uliginosibacterium aquaticum]NSL54713.1 N(2)-fixation sustaining protein CowN [Uliginosibacterium aquaticum]